MKKLQLKIPTVKTWKYEKKNLHVSVVVDCTNFAIEYLRENEEFRESIFACSYGAQVEYFQQKNNGTKSRETVPLISDIFMDKDSGAVQCPSPVLGIPGSRPAFKGHQRGATPVLELFHL